MIIGREKQQQQLLSLLESDESQFCAVYGRRRVGKTFLIRQTFGNRFVFEHTGLSKGSKAEQLSEFRESLRRAGMSRCPIPKTWFDAFHLLEQLLSSQPEGKKVVFIDELPWMDTPKSRFLSALEHFWNGWANTRNDIVLIVCGSATSWIIKNILKNYGGLYGRLTSQIYLRPFSLAECEQYADRRSLYMTRKDILETYMVLGGIPYYWSLFKANLSWAQNIDALFFAETGVLKNEFKLLYASLFRSPQIYIDIVTVLGKKKVGMTFDEIDKALDADLGGKLTEKLEELEQCNFIRSYSAIGKKKKDTRYQLIDNYTLFYFKFIESAAVGNRANWLDVIGSQTYHAWSGLAFERVCFQHEKQILNALGISGVSCEIYSWTYRGKSAEQDDFNMEGGNSSTQGAQIDMLIDRKDNVINICEMKFSKELYTLSKSDDEDIRRKLSVFRLATNTRKALRVVMITSFGEVRNAYSNSIPNHLTMDDLFKNVE